MRNIHDPPCNLDAIRSGVFPWNKCLSAEFIERTRHFRAATVLDLCAGSGHLGISVARAVGAKSVILVEVDPASCLVANRIWDTHAESKVYVIQEDVRNLAPFSFCNGLVISSPPCAPLPDSFQAWRNVYGGRDGLLYVRIIFEWLLQCQNHTLFFIATYFLSQTKKISIEDLSKAIGVSGVVIKNIYHFQEPAWNWIGMGDTKNPGYSEENFEWYLNYCDDNEREEFLMYLRRKPYTHHIMIEGRTIKQWR